MNRSILFTASLLIALLSKAQTVDTVSTSSGYSDQVWYKLDSGAETRASLSSWDFAFQISGFASSIIANTANGANLYVYPNGDIASWATLDTAGISSWKAIHNSSINWDLGAFNQGIDTSNAFDLGWGVYNFISHNVVGDSLFVWQDANGNISKVWIERLASGSFTFYVADYPGTTIDTVVFSKSNFVGKQFAYYSIAQNTVLDLEPLATDWDLVFSKYMEDINGSKYPVSGIRTNPSVEAVQVYPVANPSAYSNYNSHTYSKEINIIGHDWKEFNFNSFQYDIADSTVYIVKLDSNNYWKVVMQGFGGSANGDYIFSKTKMGVTGIFENGKELGNFTLYPNPSTERNITIVVDLNEQVNSSELSVLNLSGKVVYQTNLQMVQGMNSYPIQLNNIESGVYIVQLRTSKGMLNSKLILK